MTRQNAARPTSWSSNMHYGMPRNPLDDYRGGKPNREQKRAMKRLMKRKKVDA